MSKPKDPADIQCPACGYYCLGKGGFGCIDKPSLQDTAPPPSGHPFNNPYDEGDCADCGRPRHVHVVAEVLPPSDGLEQLDRILIDLYKSAMLHGETQSNHVLPTPEQRETVVILAKREIAALLQAEYQRGLADGKGTK